MSCLSNPFDIAIDNVQIILGPRVGIVPKEIFLEEGARNLRYNENNCYNIFTHQIQFNYKGKLYVKS